MWFLHQKGYWENSFIVLDKETSGLLITAKNEPTFQKMVVIFSQREIQKEYLAIVDRPVVDRQKKIVSKLAPRHHWEGQTVYGSTSFRGKEAITHWKLLKQGSEASLLWCYPVTGRTHQIRVHLKEAGHPVLGDYQYARHFHCSLVVRRHLLHAYRIKFLHPSTKKQIKIKGRPPS